MPEEEVVVSSPNEEGTGGGTPPVDGSAATTEEEVESRKKWFSEMRGWIMVVAVQIVSFTYQAGLNPPDRFAEVSKEAEPPTPSWTRRHKDTIVEDQSPDCRRYKVFVYSNTTAFLTSLAIIILLMNRSFYSSLAKVRLLEVIVVLDMIGLMAAFWAGSRRKDETNVYALELTALILSVIYVVYMVQLVRKLNIYAVPLVRKLWGLLLATVRRRVAVPAARTATPDDDSAAPPVPNQQEMEIHDTWAPPPVLDIGRSESELRRRDSRLLQRTPGTGRPTMRSP